MERTFTEREKKDALEFAYCMGLNRENSGTVSEENDALSFAIAMGLNTDNSDRNDYRVEYNNNLVCKHQRALG